MVSLFSNNQWVRRDLVGTFQITSLNNIDFCFSAVISTTALLGVGNVAKRCIVAGEEVEVRPTIYLSLVGHHRVLDGVKAVAFLNEVKRLLENPHELKE